MNCSNGRCRIICRILPASEKPRFLSVKVKAQLLGQIPGVHVERKSSDSENGKGANRARTDPRRSSHPPSNDLALLPIDNRSLSILIQ